LIVARLCANENLPLPVAVALRAKGHDVLTVQESAGQRPRLTDEEVLEFAARERRIVLTLNRKHFIRLHAARPGHSGIIVCSSDPDFQAQAERIHEILRADSPLEARLVRVNRAGT
jgi:uncharacterized protein with PIN domain